MAYVKLTLITAMTFLLANDANAQRWAYRHAARMHAMHSYHAPPVYVPPVAVAVTPRVGVTVRTPYYSYSGPSPSYYGYYGMWGATVSPGGVSVSVNRPVATPAHAGVVVAGPSAAGGPTPAALPERGALPPAPSLGGDLVSQLADANKALHARLQLSNGGKGWQKYFAMSDNAVRSSVDREKMLRRMDSVDRDAQFRKISSLPEFQSVRSILQAMAGASQPVVQPASAEAPRFQPNQPEAIPSPETKPEAKKQPTTDTGERSVLKG